MKSLILKIALAMITVLSLPYIVESCTKAKHQPLITLDDVKTTSRKLFVKGLNNGRGEKLRDVMHSTYKSDTIITMVLTDQSAEDFYYNFCKGMAETDPIRIENYGTALKQYFNYYKIAIVDGDEIVVEIRDHISNIKRLSY
jgi:hypothetical protein